MEYVAILLSFLSILSIVLKIIFFLIKLFSKAGIKLIGKVIQVVKESCTKVKLKITFMSELSASIKKYELDSQKSNLEK